MPSFKGNSCIALHCIAFHQSTGRPSVFLRHQRPPIEARCEAKVRCTTLDIYTFDVERKRHGGNIFASHTAYSIPVQHTAYGKRPGR